MTRTYLNYNYRVQSLIKIKSKIIQKLQVN
jgi:hypothetical protein